MGKKAKLAAGADPRLRQLLNDPAGYFTEARARANASARIQVTRTVKATRRGNGSVRSHA